MPCILPPILGKNLKLLLIGQNPARKSCENGVYFTSRTRFWELLYWSNLTKEILVRKESEKVIGNDKDLRGYYGIGITDLVHTAGAFNHGTFTKEERNRLNKEIEESNPAVLGFIGIKAYRTFMGTDEEVCYGPQKQYQDRHVFVLPFPTGSHMTDENRVVIYNDLAQIVKDIELYRIPGRSLLINPGCNSPICVKCLGGNCTDPCCEIHTLDKKYQFRLRAGIVRRCGG